MMRSEDRNTLTKLAAIALAALLSACSLYTDAGPDASPDAEPSACELACGGPEDRDCVDACAKCEEAAQIGPEQAAQCCADLDAVGPACE